MRIVQQGRDCAVSAPGKLILMGEHSVVYGRPALVAAIDLRARVECSPAGDARVCLRLVDLGHEEDTSWPEVRSYADAARARWRRYESSSGREDFAVVRGSDPAHVVKVALGEAVRAAALEEPAGMSLTVASDVPIGSGFGSSAAVAVATIAGLLAFHGRAVETGLVTRAALETERRQHGFPSGVDHTTVLRGGVLWAERDLASGSLRAEELRVDEDTLGRLQIFDTGRPAEDTGEVVAAVRARHLKEPERAKAVLDRMDRATRSMRTALAGGMRASDRMRACISDFEGCLEELGVVPEPVRALVASLADAGSAAKVSGAGALSGPGAGCLLVHPGSAAESAVATILSACRPVTAALGVPGLAIGGVE